MLYIVIVIRRWLQLAAPKLRVISASHSPPSPPQWWKQGAREDGHRDASAPWEAPETEIGFLLGGVAFLKVVCTNI